MNVWLLIAALLGGRAVAAPGLSWAEALAETKAKNPALAQAAEALRQARLGALNARAQFLPKASLSASENQGGSYNPLDGPLGSLGASGAAGYGLGLNGSLNLFNGFSNLAALKSADARLAAAEASYQESVAGVAYSLRQAFAALIFSAEEVDLLASLAARARENQDMVELRYEAGAENKGSFLQAKALASQARYDAERATRQLRSASLALSRVMGRDPESGLVAAGSLEAPASPGEPDFKKLVDGVPAVLRARYQIEAAEGASLGAWSPFLPSLNALASLNRAGDSWAPQQGSWSTGLSLSLPFFSAFNDALALKQAKSAELSARAGADDARAQARLDLESAWQALVDAVASVELRAESLEANLARAEIGRAQYAQGLMNFESWDQIESQLSNSRKAELSSHLDAVTAKAAWDRAQGKGFEP